MLVNTQLVQSIRSCVFPKYTSVTVALSGGIDSVVMLHACLQLRSQTENQNFKVNAIHVHHGLSANADNWLVFCRDLCAKHQVEFMFQKVQVAKQARMSLEALARNLRYCAIDNLVSPDSLVLLAQHEDDQAETVLLQLKRGAGPKGLSGMARAFTKSTALEYARPWIAAGIGKQDVLDYAAHHQLTWVEDESNKDPAFERNFLRNEVMPILKKKWPQITKTISRSAELAAVQNHLVESFAKEALQKITKDTIALSIAGLHVLPNSLATEVIRMWSANQTSLMPSFAQLNEIQKLCEAKPDQVGVVQVKNWQCRRFNQHLYWLHNERVCIEPCEPFSLNIKELAKGSITQGNVTIRLIYSKPKETQAKADNHSDIALNDVDLDDTLSRRNQLEPSRQKANTELSCIVTTVNVIDNITITYGDLQRKVKMDGSRPTKSIKAWMKEWQIKPWRRMAMPILVINDEVLGIVTEDTINLCHTFSEHKANPHLLRLAITLV